MPKNTDQDNFRLAVESLYHRCDLSQLPFQTTADLQSEDQHLGQKRAMDALKFGIGINHKTPRLKNYSPGNRSLQKRQQTGATSIISRSTITL